jgi:uncharacterized protein (TIGR00251 family)
MKEPKDAVKESDGTTRVEFDVSAGTDETVVPSGFNEWRGRFEARLSEPARDGRANRELIENIQETVGAESRLVGGSSSTKKTVEVTCTSEVVLDSLCDILNDRR